MASIDTGKVWILRSIGSWKVLIFVTLRKNWYLKSIDTLNIWKILILLILESNWYLKKFDTFNTWKN